MYRAELNGDFSLHGTTRKLNFATQVVRGEDSLRAYGEFKLTQTDFGIALPSVANGAIKMKDDRIRCFFVVLNGTQTCHSGTGFATSVGR
jgi:polyisoprenoid-binding protein YceI